MFPARIRAYNRISIFIAFFSLMAVGIAIESFYRRGGTTRNVVHVLLPVVFILAVLDQTTAAYRPTYEKTKAEFLSDRQFVNGIEASLPAGR